MERWNRKQEIGKYTFAQSGNKMYWLVKGEEPYLVSDDVRDSWNDFRMAAADFIGEMNCITADAVAEFGGGAA